MITLLIVSILVLVVGFIGALLNITNQANQMFKPKGDPFGSFGGTFKRHALFAVFIFLGGLGTLISGITFIVRAFSQH